MFKVSVIVPVYNSHNYLSKCIDSLVNQTLKNIEIILVNDGSTDDSLSIMEKYKQKFNNIKIINKKNGGQSSARNLGLTKASGEYILYIDSDDYIDVKMCEKMYNKAKMNNSDIVLCDYYIVECNKKNRVTIIEDDADNNNISNQQYFLTPPAPWNKLFKREFLQKNNFKFPEGIIYEDYAEVPTLILYNPCISYVKSPFCFYVQSENSTMRNLTYKKKYEDIFFASDYLYNKLKKHKEIYPELEYRFISHFLYEGSLNFYKYKKYDKIKKISRWMKQKFPNWRNNKYYKSKNLKYKVLCNLFYLKQIWLIDFIRKFK